MHHEAFLEDLKHRLEAWEQKTTIGDWFLESVSYHIGSIKPILANFSYPPPPQGKGGGGKM